MQPKLTLTEKIQTGVLTRAVVEQTLKNFEIQWQNMELHWQTLDGFAKDVYGTKMSAVAYQIEIGKKILNKMAELGK